MFIFIERHREQSARSSLPFRLSFDNPLISFRYFVHSFIYIAIGFYYIYRYTIYYMIFSSIFCLTQKQQVMKIKQNNKTKTCDEK